MASAALKDKLPLLLAGVIVIAAIVAYSKAGSSTSIGAQVVAPNNSSTDAANVQIAATNAASSQAYNQSVVQEFEQMVGFGNNIQTNATNVQLAGIAADVQKTQYGDQLQASIAQTQAQEQLTAANLQAQQTMYNDQLQAIKTQSNNQTKQNIFGQIFGTIGAIFGI